jgi:hypothetical protein
MTISSAVYKNGSYNIEDQPSYTSDNRETLVPFRVSAQRKPQPTNSEGITV